MVHGDILDEKSDRADKLREELSLNLKEQDKLIASSVGLIIEIDSAASGAITILLNIKWSRSAAKIRIGKKINIFKFIIYKVYTFSL